MANILINVDTLPATPETGFTYFLTTAATVYPIGTFVHDGTGWVCVQQLSAIALANWTVGSAVSLTLCPGVTYTVTASGAPASLAIALTTIGSAMIIKTGAYAIPEPSSGKKLTSIGLDALAVTATDIQIIIEKIGSTIVYSAADLITLS